MKISLDWLKDYIKIKQDIDTLVHELTMKSVEVDDVIDFKKLWTGIVVGEIIHIQKHPKADKLHLTKIDTGIKIYDIVCGGVNIQKGQKVPVALVGTTLPNGITIEKKLIRGHESEGMLCGADELGLMKEGDRMIMILDESLKNGTPLSKALQVDEPVIDIDVLPNRSDLMGHAGLAREIAALFELKYSPDKHVLPKNLSNTLQLEIKIDDPMLVPRYSVLVIEGITVQESPHWLKSRLRGVGIRSINNIVDLTNYIMFDLGIPMHAFDYDKIEGKSMTLRASKKGEHVKTLDGTDRKLPEGSIVIHDAKKIIDLAGIMGGDNSAITQNTKRIVLQSAEFDPMTIRRTSRVLGHRTDAVALFEKGVDRASTQSALAKAFDLLQEMDSGAILKNSMDIQSIPYKSRTIELHASKYKKLIGVEITKKEAKEILSALNCEFEEKEKDIYNITPPSFRKDLNIEEDIIEEIARIKGYNTLPETMPTVNLTLLPKDTMLDLTSKATHYMVSVGFQEVLNYSFTSQKRMQMLNLNSQDHVAFENPMSAEHAFLRSELISSLLHNVYENQRWDEHVSVFEIAKTYHPEIKTEPKEKTHLSAATAGGERNFYHMKGIAESMLKHFGYEHISFEKQSALFREKSQGTVYIMCDDVMIGYIGILPEKIQKKFDIEKPTYILDIDLDTLNKSSKKQKLYTPLPAFPPVLYDIAIIVDADRDWSDIHALIMETGGEMLKEVEVFDIYTGNQIPKDKKSIAFHLVYKSSEKTLTQEEVEPIHQRVIEKLKISLQAELRAQV